MKKQSDKQPWNPRKATEEIRKVAKNERLDLCYTNHARDRLEERGIVTRDILYLLQNGFIHKEAKKTTRRNCFKYTIEGKTPNSNNRTLVAVVIPKRRSPFIKIITIMWKDKK